MKKSLLTFAAVVGIILFSLNTAANAFDWYKRFVRYDKWMHAIGGMFVLFAIGAYLIRWREHSFSVRNAWLLLAALLIVGVAWEGYEYIVQALTGTQLATLPDSLSDVALDMFGGFIGVALIFFVQRRKKRYNERYQ